jgi:hypothetical protein
MDLRALSVYHQSTRQVVAAFIRHARRSYFFADDSYHNNPIPALIAIITTIYYDHAEYFSSHGSKLSLKHGIHTIRSFGSFTDYSRAYNSVYGNIRINATGKTIKYQWTFRVFRELYPRGIFAIGIDSSNKQYVDTTFYDRRWNPEPCYSLQFEAGDVAVKYSQSERNKKYAPCKYKEITIINMELDVKRETLSYSMDGIDHGVAFENVDFNKNRQYWMALILDNATIIEMIDFCQIYK